MVAQPAAVSTEAVRKWHVYLYVWERHQEIGYEIVVDSAPLMPMMLVHECDMQGKTQEQLYLIWQRMSKQDQSVDSYIERDIIEMNV